MGRRVLVAVSLQMWATYMLIQGLVRLTTRLQQETTPAWADAELNAADGQVLVLSLVYTLTSLFLLTRSRWVARVLLPQTAGNGDRHVRPILAASLVCAGFTIALHTSARLAAYLISPWPERMLSYGGVYDNAGNTLRAAVTVGLGMAVALLPRALSLRRGAAPLSRASSAQPRVLAAATFPVLGMYYIAITAIAAVQMLGILATDARDSLLAPTLPAGLTPLFLYVGLPGLVFVCGLLLVRHGSWVASRLTRAPPVNAGSEPHEWDRGALRWFGLGVLGTLAALTGASFFHASLTAGREGGASPVGSLQGWTAGGYLVLAIAAVGAPRPLLRLARGLKTPPRTFDREPLTPQGVAQLLQIGLGAWFVGGGLQRLTAVLVRPGSPFDRTQVAEFMWALGSILAGGLLFRIGPGAGTLRSTIARTSLELAALVLLWEMIPDLAAWILALRRSGGGWLSPTASWHGVAVPWGLLVGLAVAAGCLWWSHRGAKTP